MNWIETLLHVAPDHGDGASEALLFALLFALLLLAARGSGATRR